MKLFHVISTAILGAAMSIGVGLAVANTQRAMKAEASTGSYTFTYALNTNKNGTGDTCSEDSGTEFTSAKFLSSGTNTYSVNKVSYYWIHNGYSDIASIQGIANVYPGKNNSIKVGKAKGDGVLKFTVAGDANLTIDSVVITAYGGDSGVLMTIDEANEATKQQTLNTSSSNYTFTYASGVRTVSITAGKGTTSNNKPAYVTQITVNYTVSSADTHKVTTSTEGLYLAGDLSVIDGEAAEIALTTDQKKKFTNLVVTGAGVEDTDWYLDGTTVNILSVENDVTINATIVDAPITSIALSGQKTSFAISESFSFGGKVTGTYADYAPTHGTRVLESEEYTIDSSNFQKGVVGTYEITVSYTGAPSVKYNVTVANVEIYSLFSGALVEGDYVVVYNGKALKATISSNRFGYSEPTIVDNTITDPAANIVWHIEQVSGGYWTLFNADVNKYAGGTTSKNQGALLSSVDDHAKWTVTGAATYEFENLGRSNDSNDPGNKYLRENGTSGWACYGSGTGGALSLYKLPDTDKPVVNSRMTAGTVSASSGDTNWTLSGFVFEVLYEDEAEYTNVTLKTTFSVNKAVPQIDDDGILEVTVTPTFKGVEYTAKAETLNATLTFVNLHTIAQLYDSSATNIDYEVDGIYMGEVADGYIFMNGEYGILVYDKTHSETLSIGGSYKLEGTRDVYKDLVELKDVTVTELPNGARKNHIEAPVIYEVVGGETADKANRKTSLTGVVKSISSTTVGSVSTVVVTVNATDITVFIKATYATQTNFDALVDSRDHSKNITIEGFTSWFDAFQVQLTNIVIPVESYSIYDFAKDLLKLTRTTCTGGSFDMTTNKPALTSLWSTLSGAEYYGKLDATKKAALAAGTADKDVVVPNTDSLIDAMTDTDALGAALYRYDYCTAKYGLTPFIEGRSLSVSFASNVSINLFSNNNMLITIAIIASAISLTSIGCFFIIRRKKHN